jgi:alanine racemase
MPRPIRAAVSAGALAHNLRVAQRHARSDTGGAKIWAVIKANAYGHGLERAAQAFEAADGFAVLDFQEAARLRVAGVAKPILMLEGVFKPGDVPLLHEYALTPVIHNPAQVEMLRGADLPGAIDVYVKVNSGMNRLGFTPESFGANYQALREHPRVKTLTLMTHFADADGATGVKAQLEWFGEMTKSFAGSRSLANSAALLRFPETHADWVRPGIMLYGCSPFADRPAEALGLKPAMHEGHGSALISFLDFELGRGLGAVFLYVMMLARYGPGRKTAVGAALVLWLISSVSGPAQFIPLGFYSQTLWMKVAAIQLVTTVAATLAGTAIYRGDRAAAGVADQPLR